MDLRASKDDSNGVNIESNAHILELKREHAMFAEEAFTYLLQYFGIKTETRNDFQLFTPEMGEAIITISYTFRQMLRSSFQDLQTDPNDINEFQKIAGAYEVIADDHYFYCIIERLSKIFELTMYCLKEGYDYIDIGCKIAANDGDPIFFESNGGWCRLNETASFIAGACDLLHPVIREEKPQDVVLKSFVKSVQDLESHQSHSLSSTKKGFLNLLKRSVVHKLDDISTVDPRVIKVFYHTLCRPTFYILKHMTLLTRREALQKNNFDIENEKRDLIHSFCYRLKMILGETEDIYRASSLAIQLADQFVTIRYLTDLVSVASAGLKKSKTISECKVIESKNSQSDKMNQSSNQYYFVKIDYIQMRETSRVVQLTQNTNNWVNVPSSKIMHVKNIRKVLDDNIDSNNYFKLGNGQFVVYTPECKFDEYCTVIIVTE